MLAPLLLALSLSLSYAGPTQNEDDKTPSAPTMPTGRCWTQLHRMNNAVNDMDAANQSMEDAYNSGDLDAMGKASGRFDQASRDYSDSLEVYNEGNCANRIDRDPPDRPKKWTP